MSGTKAGGLKAAKTNKLKHGKDFYARIGRMGGRNGHTGGFASMPTWKVQEAGRKGGRKSTRAGIKNGEGKNSKVNRENNMKRIIVEQEQDWKEYIEVKHGC